MSIALSKPRVTLPVLLVIGAFLSSLVLSGCSTTSTIAERIQPTTEARLTVVKAAASQLGKPYRAGERGPSAFDDNSLISYAYRAAGVGVPLAAHAQLGAGEPVAMDQAEPGDLVFYQTELAGGEDSLRVGLYLNETEMLYASSKRGQVIIQPIDDDWWTQRLLGVVKILP